MEFSDVYLCKWKWFRHPVLDASHPSSPQQTSEDTRTSLEDTRTLSENTRKILSTSYTYWPSEEDAGYQLFVECTPTSSDGRTGELVTALSPVITSQSPRDTPITRRHLLTPWQLAEPDHFRMVTYNTLASIFTEESYARDVLYPYCEPSALDIQYRQGHLVHELIGYNADVISLQEVGTMTFEKFFKPVFLEKGYESFYQKKHGSVSFCVSCLECSHCVLVRQCHGHVWRVWHSYLSCISTNLWKYNYILFSPTISCYYYYFSSYS